MRKIRFFLMIIGVVLFFVCNNTNVNAIEYNVSELPVASDITYGEPLFQSELVGGSSEVSGFFSWKEIDKRLSAGLSREKIIFTPNDSSFPVKEFEIDINVNQRRVYLQFERDLEKQYDSYNSLKLPAYIICGILDNSVYLKGILKATLESVFIGDSVKVSFSGVELVGEKVENYYLDLEGYSAKVYPKFIEMFGNIKNRIDFIGNDYVPVNSVIHIEKSDRVISRRGYDVKSVYDISVVSNNDICDVSDKIKVKIKIDEKDFEYRRLELYNYYDSEYQKLDYVYKDGYLIYECEGLGELLFLQRKLVYEPWFAMILVVISICLLVGVYMIFIYNLNKKEKICKYSSIRRSKDEDCC